MKLYLDTSVLLPYLFGELDAPERYLPSVQLFGKIDARGVQAVVTFYALQEVYGYIVRRFPSEDTDRLFRVSLQQLLMFPLVVVPYLDRTVVRRWRHRLQLGDATDVFHVAAALIRGCDAIVTYDHRFQEVAEHIPAWTSEECLASLEQAESEGSRE